MKTTEANLNKLKYLSSICKDSTSFKTRFATLSLNKTKYPQIFDVILLFIEYAQLVSQSIIINFNASPNQEISSVSHVIFRIAQIFSPGCLITFGKQTNFLTELLLFLLLWIIAKYLLFIYVLLICKKNDYKRPRALITVWKWLVKIQSRVLYYSMTSFWFNALLVIVDDKYDFEVQDLFIIIMSCIAIPLDLVFSFVHGIGFTSILPSNFLSSKSMKIETITLLQKFVIQVLELITFFRTSHPWILAFIQIAFCWVRDSFFIYELPLYKIKALLYQARLLMMVSWINIAGFIQIIFQDHMTPTLTLDFTLITWIMMSIIGSKILTARLNNLVVKMTTTKFSNHNPKILAHKVNIIKQCIKNSRVLTDLSTTYSSSHLITMHFQTKLQEIFNLEMQPTLEEINKENPKEYLNKFSILYLENLQRRFPNDQFVKLYTGYFYAKKLKAYGICLGILTELHQTGSYFISLNASLLLEDIQNDLFEEYKKSSATIDLHTFAKNISYVAEIKLKMLDQAEKQEQLYKEIISDWPNLGNISTLADHIYHKRRCVIKSIKMMMDTIPDYYVDPLIVCAHYQLALNHSEEEFKKLSQLYWRKYQKYEKFFNQDRLCNENSYQRDNGFFLISAEKKTAWKTTYCSPSIFKLYGKDITDLNFSNIVMPILLEFYKESFKVIIEQGSKVLLDKMIETIGYQFEGKHIFLVDYYMNIHSFLGKGYLLFALNRNIVNSKEYLVLSETGYVEYSSTNIGIKLGLVTMNESQKTKVHASKLCPELKRINKAFNMKAFPEKYNRKDVSEIKTEISEDKSKYDTDLSHDDLFLTMSQAEELYNIFTTEGKDLQISPWRLAKQITMGPQINEEEYMYHCTIQNQLYGNILLKIITLEETQSNEFDKKTETHKQKIINNSNSETEEKFSWEAADEISLRDCRHQNFYQKQLQIELDFNANIQESVPQRTDRTAITAYFPTTERGLLTSREKETTDETGIDMNVQTQSNSKAKDNKFIQKRDIKPSTKTPKIEVITENDSQKSNSNKVSQIYKTFVNLKYAPSYYRVLLFLMILAFGILFANHIFFYKKTDNNMSLLRTYNTIFQYIDTKNYHISLVHAQIRMVWCFFNGRQNIADYPSWFSISNLLKGIVNDIETVSKLNIYNQQSFKNLDPVYQSLLYERVVPFYDNYYKSKVPTIRLDSIQALNEVISITLKAAEIATYDLSASMPFFEVVMRNDVNDLYMRNIQIRSKISFLGHTFIEDTRTLNLIARLIPVVTLLVILGALFIVGFKQLKQEKNLLLSLIKLNPKGISFLIKQTSQFKNNILEDVQFDALTKESNNLIDMKENYNNIVKKYRNDLKPPNSKSLYKQYYFAILKGFIIFSILLLALGASFQFTMNHIQNSIDQFNQLIFWGRIKAGFANGLPTSLDLLSEKNVTLIRNLSTFSVLEMNINSTRYLKNSISSLFSHKELQNNPILKAIL